MMTNPDVLAEPLAPCPACGKNTWKMMGQVKDYSVSGEWFELHECVTCGLRATHPQPGAAEIGRYYASQDYVSHSDTRKGLINRLYHLARERMLKKKAGWVMQHSRHQKGRLLDIGAGTGYFAHHMKTIGWDVLALEPDASARQVASEKLGLTIRNLDALPTLEPHSWDVITLWHVLEHVQDLNGYMDHFKTLLAPGGTLCIAVPNYTSKDAHHYGWKWAAYDVPRHLWHFSPGSVLQLCTRHQFQVKARIPMHLDAYYVGMLSEKYLGHDVFGPAGAFLQGLKTFMAARQNVEKASSILYIIQ